MAIRTKLAIWISLLVAALLVLLTAARYAGQRELLLDQKDYGLKAVAGILDASLPRTVPSGPVVERAFGRLMADYPEVEWDGVIIEVYDASRTLLFSSSVLEQERLPVTEAMWGRAFQGQATLSTVSATGSRSPVRLFAKPVYSQDKLLYLIQVGSSMRDIQVSLENFLFLNMLLIPAAMLLMGAGGWWLTRRALKPLEEVVRTAYRISFGGLNHRIQIPPSGREIRDLAEAFNHMISRLGGSFRKTQEFSDNVSHELRIPLAILRGETELCLRRLRTAEEYRDTLASNLEEVLRMEKIVERLLLLSRMDRGEISLRLERLDLSGLLEEVQAQFRQKAREKGVQLGYEKNGPAFVNADAVLIREVFDNLVQNALAHTPEGGRISLSLQEAPEEFRISVADTGCGIPEEDLPHVFDRFYKVDKSRSGEGSGLGLSLCQRIVQAHHGRISAQSAVGQGSRFTVSLPLS